MEISAEKLKTSIAVDRTLWDRFDVELRRRWRERSYSRGLERVIAQWLNDESIAPATQNARPHSPEIEALIAWYQNPPKRFDKALKMFLRERLEELRAAAGNRSEHRKENAG